MCTVSLIIRKGGYVLGMNRDEKRSRQTGLYPSQKNVAGRAIVSPSEPGGGTWIALNDLGVCIALINWYSIVSRVARDSVSRGEVVNAVCAADSVEFVEATFKSLPLHRVNPFRLIGVFPGKCEVFEWQWNLKKLLIKRHPWKTNQWASSGFDEPTARRIRGETFTLALRQTSFSSAQWLRRLHGSHKPHAGPFSTCMHREDAETVSYTEVALNRRHATMWHHLGPPCQINPNRPLMSLTLSPPLFRQSA